MAKKETQKENRRDAANFEEATAELEKIVRDLEDGKLGLAEAMQRYEQGVGLLQRCYQLLESAERRIELLSGIDADGKFSPSSWIVLPDRDVLHIPGLGVNGTVGLRIYSVSKNTFGLGLSAEQAASADFKNGSKPG